LKIQLLSGHFTSAIGAHPRISDLIARLKKLELKPGFHLIRQGDKASDVFFLASGRLRVQITSPDGTVLRLRTMMAGAIVGEIALYLNQTRTADVIIDKPSVIYKLSKRELNRMEREDPELAALAHNLLANNLSEKLAVANRAIHLATS
jgi:SulP family sulfate permease